MRLYNSLRQLVRSVSDMPIQLLSLMLLRISACPKRKRAAGLISPVELATPLVYHLPAWLVQRAIGGAGTVIVSTHGPRSPDGSETSRVYNQTP